MGAKIGAHIVFVASAVSLWELIRTHVLALYTATGGGSLAADIINHMIYVALVIVAWESLKSIVAHWIAKRAARSL